MLWIFIHPELASLFVYFAVASIWPGACIRQVYLAILNCETKGDLLEGASVYRPSMIKTQHGI